MTWCAAINSYSNFMATYKVVAGDTVDAIAKRFGVSRTAVSGYRSADPNTIFPGEELQIGTPQPAAPIATPDGKALVAPGGIPQGTTPVAPTQPVQPPAPIATQPVAPTLPQAPTAPLSSATPTAPTSTITPTPSLQPGMAPQKTGAPTLPGQEEERDVSSLLAELQQSDPELASKYKDILTPERKAISQYGVDPDAVESGFQTNPFGTISSLVQQVMQATGLPDVRENITKMANEIESLANERDEKIQTIQDNPWKSASTKATEIKQIADSYEKKLKNRTDRVTLLQSTYEDARQQAQFAATTAIGLYDKSRSFQAEQLNATLDREEKRAEALAKLNEPLSPSEAKTLGVPFGTTASQAYGITPRVDSGLPGELTPKQTSVAIQLANSLKSHPAYTDMSDIYTGIQGVQTGLSQKNGFGDITAINAFQRMVDPGATVREGDVALLQSASAFINKVLSDYPIEKLTKGAKLPEATRAQMQKTADELYERRAKNYNQTIGTQYKSLSGGSGIPFEFVGQDFPTQITGTKTEVIPPEIVKETEDITFKAPSSWQSFFGKLFD